ncbi:hypothetical protein RHMOL_Rhmol13G0215800 [Rhododendron molle]|uniref:Uncharacterized protein n=1 Tax=Rhododendron molle TaxID=49168 RepID=A0ACC0L954_RHOML|nr:hypothetical protein RHMOL_Rhmol13G0215800 [Rhododendron molle]
MIMSQWLKSHPGSIIVSPGSLLPLLLCFAGRFPSTAARSSTRLPRGVVGFKCTVVAERNGAAARGRVEVESGVFRVLGRRESSNSDSKTSISDVSCSRIDSLGGRQAVVTKSVLSHEELQFQLFRLFQNELWKVKRKVLSMLMLAWYLFQQQLPRINLW